METGMDIVKSGAAKLGINLTEMQLFLFREYYEELSKWNEIINLTSVVEYEDIQRRHFVDSLTVAEAMMKHDDMKKTREGLLLDIGSGAGLPGLPLAIALPELKVTLVESIGKKARFLEHVVNKLGLPNVEVVNNRAEELAHSESMREKYDYVTARGVGQLATLAEIMLPFCKVGGTTIAIKGAGMEDEVGRAMNAIHKVGGKLEHIIQVKLEELARTTMLVIMCKEHPTPENYPRRTGVPFKRPIVL